MGQVSRHETSADETFKNLLKYDTGVSYHELAELSLSELNVSSETAPKDIKKKNIGLEISCPQFDRFVLPFRIYFYQFYSC